MLGWVCGAGGDECDIGIGRKDRGRGVISFGVYGAAAARASGAGEAPVDCWVSFAAAGERGVKGLRSAEFDADDCGRDRDGDIAGDRNAGGGGLGRVGLAGRGHLDFCALGEVRGGVVESIGRNHASLSGAAGDTVDAPGDGSVGRVGDGGGERKCFTEEHAAGSGRDGDGDL